MKQVADVLLRFPPAGQDAEQLSDEAYDKQIKIHAGRVQSLFKESAQIVAAHAVELLDVRVSPVLVLASSAPLPMCPAR